MNNSFASEKNMFFGYTSSTSTVNDTASADDLTTIISKFKTTLADCQDLLQTRIDWNNDFKEYIHSICDLNVPGNGAKVLKIIQTFPAEVQNYWSTKWKAHATRGSTSHSKSAYNLYLLQNIFVGAINQDLAMLSDISSTLEKNLTKNSIDAIYTVIFTIMTHAEYQQINTGKDCPQDWNESVILYEIIERIFQILPADYRQNFKTYISFPSSRNGDIYYTSATMSPAFFNDLSKMKNDFFIPNLEAMRATTSHTSNNLNYTLFNKGLQLLKEINYLYEQIYLKQASNNTSTDSPTPIEQFVHLYSLFIDVKNIICTQDPTLVFTSEIIANDEQTAAHTEQSESAPKKKKKKNKKKNKNQAILEEPVNTASSVEPQTVDAEEENDAEEHIFQANTKPEPCTHDNNTEDTKHQANLRLQQLRLEGAQERNKNHQARNAAIVTADKQTRPLNLQDRAIKPVINIILAEKYLEELEYVFNINTEKIKYSKVETLFTNLGITLLNQRGSHITMGLSGRAVGYFETTEIDDDEKANATNKFTVVKPHGKAKTQSIMNNNLLTLRNSIKKMLPLEIQQKLQITGDSVVTKGCLKLAVKV